ncbi:MAG: Holliday junction resolvase RuvX [Pseudomonadota bacterium]
MAASFEKDATVFQDRGALLGLDIGEKTIGVASCDPDRRLATPLETIARKKLTKDAERLAVLAHERQVVGLVVGLPLNMNGDEGPRAQSSRSIAAHLSRLLELPVAFWDERLSTVAVERDMIAADRSRAKRKEVIDAGAAAFILQGAIDRLSSL